MPSHKSAEKALRQTKRKTEINKSRKKKFRSAVKDVELAVAAKNKDAAKKALVKAEAELMKAVTKKVIKLNAASRKVSRLSGKIKAIKSA